MTRQRDNIDLRVLRDDAGSLIDTFLRVRPTGGRVWVDALGNAVTALGDQTVYLGSLGPMRTGSDARAGAPVTHPSGRRFDVRPGRVIDKATGDDLSRHRSTAIIATVTGRLLGVRPAGGTYRVTADGLATTWVAGTWVYAGQIADEEWFPSHR